MATNFGSHSKTGELSTSINFPKQEVTQKESKILIPKPILNRNHRPRISKNKCVNFNKL
jgi:hypothetical protein